MSTLKVGVIGLGMGRSHIAGYQKSPHCTVVAIADPDGKRLEAAGNEYKVSGRYDDAETMLKREHLDVVSVATPNRFHKPLTIAALQAGCHVLCEKPMAMSAREAADMNAAARKAKKRIMINFSFRFNPQAWLMKREVESGLLGDVYHARTVWLRRRGMPGFGGWFGQKELAGGGPLIDLGVHRLDLALWLMGYPQPQTVLGKTYFHLGRERAKRENKPFDVEDFACALVTFRNGACLQLEASWAGHIRERELMETRLLGTRGGLIQRNLGEGYQFETEFFLEKDGCLMDMKPHDPLPPAPGAQEHFIQSILDNKPHTATGEEGETVMQLLDAIYRSADTGKPVEVK